MNREQFIAKIDCARSDNEVDDLIDNAILCFSDSPFILDIALWALLECRNGKHQPERVVDVGTRWLDAFPSELSYVTALALLHQNYSKLSRSSTEAQQVISLLKRGVTAGDTHCYFALANMYWLVGDGEMYLNAIRQGCENGSYDCSVELLLGNYNLTDKERERARVVVEAIPNLTPDLVLLQNQRVAARNIRETFDHDSGPFSLEYCPDRFPKALCLHARRHSKHLLKRSMVSTDAGKDLVSSTRTSHGSFIPLRRMTISIIALELMLAEISGLPFSHGEQLHAIAYEPGDCFRPHRDSVYRDSDVGSVACRSITVLLGASCGYAGGATVFPKVDFSATLRCGDLLSFTNLDVNGLPHELSLHAGEPVLTGEKWVFTKWMHSKPFK